MKRTKKLILLILTCILVFSNTSVCCAKENNVYSPRAYDVRTVEKSTELSYTRSMVSIDPPQAATGIPSNVETVSFKIRMTGYLHYDYLTGKYVSASSPIVTIVYQGEVALTLNSVSTYYVDNGNSVTFYFSGNLIGKIDPGLVCVVDYGNVSGNFTVQK